MQVRTAQRDRAARRARRELLQRDQRAAGMIISGASALLHFQGQPAKPRVRVGDGLSRVTAGQACQGRNKPPQNCDQAPHAALTSSVGIAVTGHPRD